MCCIMCVVSCLLFVYVVLYVCLKVQYGKTCPANGRLERVIVVCYVWYDCFVIV